MKTRSKNLKGQHITPGTVHGKLFIARTTFDLVNCPQDAILLISSATPDIVLAFGKASGIVAEKGGVTSHAAILARECGIPCIVGVAKLFEQDLTRRRGILYADKGILTVL